ncbi:LemA family protein [Acetobacter farinalis]|uniref:LemA family protein n=1 Tax=Acetobacter farinalis TaxID=1260984 RepID=A0ABT3Q941_9PROT|nr:LemA family protein [Acetobacter farinalis]MCX2561815.1 LemA family protein [Acetobacter farinalis]NHO30267.1 LemA family protein [Acetobacter farinalis]
MKKLLIPAILLIGLLFVFGSSYNRFMAADQNVLELTGQLQNEVQRQSDLIPNLVNTVKGYATHEHDTLTDYAAARSGETPLSRIDPRTVDNATLQQKILEAQSRNTQEIKAINAVVEQSPQLQANQDFSRLMVQLEGSQNRITVARQRLQQAILSYNQTVMHFPGNLVAGILGYHTRVYYEASPEAQTPPVVDFSKH